MPDFCRSLHCLRTTDKFILCFSELLAGSNIVEAEKQKVARAEMEEALLKESADALAAAEAAAAAEKAERAKEFAENMLEEEASYLKD